MNNLAWLLEVQGKLAEAETLYRDVLDKRRRILGEEHTRTIASMDILGALLTDEGKFAEAEPLLEAAAEKFRQVKGPTHDDTLIATGKLAALRVRQQKFPEAEAMLLAAASSLEQPNRTARAKEVVYGSLVKLYDAWASRDPGKGYEQKAEQWKLKLAETAPSTAPTTTQPASTRRA
jgi:hypothetical protein